MAGPSTTLVDPVEGALPPYPVHCRHILVEKRKTYLVKFTPNPTRLTSALVPLSGDFLALVFQLVDEQGTIGGTIVVVELRIGLDQHFLEGGGLDFGSMTSCLGTECTAKGVGCQEIHASHFCCIGEQAHG